MVFEERTIKNDVNPYRQNGIMMRVSNYIKLESKKQMKRDRDR